jgi:hypothetical protein
MSKFRKLIYELKVIPQLNAIMFDEDDKMIAELEEVTPQNPPIRWENRDSEQIIFDKEEILD